LRGAKQIAWLAILDRELDNLRAALEWSLRRDAGTGLRITGSLWSFWEARGYHTEGRRWLASLLPLAPARTVARAKALHCAAVLAMRQGNVEVCEPLLSESLAIFEELGDRQGVASVLERLGIYHYGSGDYANSRRLYQESSDIYRALGNLSGVGWTLNDLGLLARLERDYDQARTLFEESLKYLRECDDRLGLAYALNNLGQLMRLEGDYERSQAFLLESLAVAREVGDKPFTGWALLSLGEVARRQGKLAEARDYFVQGIRVESEVGYARQIAFGLGALAVLVAQQGDYRGAVRLFGASEAIHKHVRTSLDVDENVSWDEAQANARESLGEEDFTRVWREGEDMTWEEAIALTSVGQ